MHSELKPISLLICEDDEEFLEILVSGLGHLGLGAVGVSDAPSLDAAFRERRPSVVILDIGLPGEDGLSIARRLRAPGPAPVGIILLSARGMLEDRIQGLRDGADLYFVKPVDLEELALAVRNLHRRMRLASQTEVPAVQPIHALDSLRSQLVFPSGTPLSLTATELRILEVLAQCPGNCVDRDAILDNLGQPQDLAAMQRLETAISRLRAKARRAGESLPLHARHGSGYAFLALLKVSA
jgi:DNA-binding response OmpR family regulator